MRWLLLFLVVLNAVALFWFGQLHKAQSFHAVDGEVSTSGVPSIALLNELGAQQLARLGAPVESAGLKVEVAAQQPVSEPPKATDETADASISAKPDALASGECGFLGPFSEPITIRQIVSRLKKEQVDVQSYRESVRIDPIYWVYLRPESNRQLALQSLRSLHAQGIDAFIVAEGEDVNAISLGFFAKKASAEKILQERLAQGFDAKLEQKERLRDQYWLVAQAEGWGRLNDQAVAELRKEYGEFTRRVRECAVIATYNKFE